MKKIIENIIVYAEHAVIENGFIEWDSASGKITALGKMDQLDQSTDAQRVDLGGQSVIPGMIDIHTHGANGADVMDATPEALEAIALAAAREGATSFVATTITQDKDLILKALQNVQDYMKDDAPTGAEVLGVHLEGPFINESCGGAQPKEYIVPPSVELFSEFQQAAGDAIRIVTVAPEIAGGQELVAEMVQQGVIVSLGHSAAKAEQAERVVELGASQVTHLFNGLPSLHHREPGIVGVALRHSENPEHNLCVEMIVDGHHLAPEIVNLVFQIKGSSNIVLVTDAMRATSLKEGLYELGGQKVHVQDGQARLENGSLAGSTLTMSEAIRNMMRYSGCALEDIIQMTSENQAKRLGVFDRKGSLKVGKDADFVVLEKDCSVMLTSCRGSLFPNAKEQAHNRSENK